jgi:hypothetical protein
MDPEIREAIMGHGDRARSVRERYGQISDQELIKAIDLMTFDLGETEIWLSSPKIKILERGKLSRTNEIQLVKMKTGAKRGQNSFALDTRESLMGKFPVFLVRCGGSDETRTPDLRRDRRAGHVMILPCYVISHPIQVHLDLKYRPNSHERGPLGAL